MPNAQLTLLDSNRPRLKSQKVAEEYGLNTFELGNRRYLGGKSKLINFIHNEIMASLKHKPNSVFDVFAGTGVVGHHYAKDGVHVVANDLLKHNYYGLETFMGNQKLNLASLAEKIAYLSKVRGKDNYFSEHFGGTYFSQENARKIGAIRDEIEIIANSSREKAALVTSLIYSADKVANTVGHYDAFHRGQNIQSSLELRFPLISDSLNSDNEIYCQDSLLIAPKIFTDVAYIDPPYNSRQYSDAYHLLENLAAWEKPEVIGVAKKMDRLHLKSDFCGRNAPDAFNRLIAKIEAKILVVSYNNTSNTLNARSNSAISDTQLIKSLESRGKVSIKEVEFNGFTAGKTKKRRHTERLFICRVDN